MSLSKDINIFIGKHLTGVSRTVIFIYVIWFISGLILVDKLDPWLFIGLWMPVGFIGAMISNRW